MKKARENFDSLSAQDKALILVDLATNSSVPLPVAAPAAPASDVFSMVFAVVDALNIPEIVKKCTKRSTDSDLQLTLMRKN